MHRDHEPHSGKALTDDAALNVAGFPADNLEPAALPLSVSPLQRARDFFESQTRERVADVRAIYAADAYFKDPFNEVRGAAEIEKIFAHMFEQVGAPRFVVSEAHAHDGQAFIIWDFRFRMRRWRRGEQTIRGASHLKFDAAGKIAFHRDYWDAAEELYEKLPLLGGLLRWLKRRAAT